MRETLTPFGRRCREFRTRYGLTMADQAKGIGFSPAYISLIELGRRPVPEGYPAQFAHWISLTEAETKDLCDLAFGKTSVIKLKSTDKERAEIAEEFARKFHILPIERLRQMRALLASAPASSYSPRQITDYANLARSLFNAEDRDDVDILKIIENHIALIDPSFTLRVKPDAEFGGAMEAYSSSNGKKVECTVVSERLYTTAAERNPYSRYQLAHEFAHWFLHRRQSRAFYRATRVPRKSAKIENEADLFARAFLFPRSLVEKYNNPERLARAVCIPTGVAKKAITEIRERILEDSLRGIAASPNLQPSLPAENTARVIPFPRAHGPQIVQKQRTKRGRTEQQSEDLFSYADRLQRKSSQVLRSKSWYDEHGWR
jgi:transcriptional regulator with XRE-family HTH domain